MALSDPDQPLISPLLEGDLPDAEALVREAGWNQTASDWQAFLNTGTVYAIRASGRVIATAAVLPYGGQFAWISMVLVARDYQRRGLATRLLRRCIDDLQAARLVPVLDATPAGRKVYSGLGFVDTWSFQRYARGDQMKGAGTPVPAIENDLTVRAITDVVWKELCSYDAKIFGADRSVLLGRLRGRAPQVDSFAERGGRIVGMVLGRDGLIATQIGPLVADDEDTAQALVRRAVSVTGGAIFIDVPGTKIALISRLAAEGFASQRPFTRMLLGRATAYDDGQKTFALAGPEFG